MKLLLPVFVVLSLGSLLGCASHMGHAGHGAGHAHVAPHGGTLVEVGEHAYAVELVRDSVAGKLTAYVLDAHAQSPVRIKSATIDFVAMPGGKFTPVSLRAVADPAVGESVGDTSQFEYQADWLKTADEFAGIFTIEIGGSRFEQVAYTLPK